MAMNTYKKCLDSFVETRHKELKEIQNNKEKKLVFLKIGEKHNYFSIDNLSRDDELAAIFLCNLQVSHSGQLFDVEKENGKPQKVTLKSLIIADDFGYIFEFEKFPTIKYSEIKSLIRKYI